MSTRPTIRPTTPPDRLTDRTADETTSRPIGERPVFPIHFDPQAADDRTEFVDRRVAHRLSQSARIQATKRLRRHARHAEFHHLPTTEQRLR